MTRYFSAAETAKLVRSALKVAFPGVKFSVRSSTYSMGSHVNVTWLDGPATKAVQAITNQYRGSGMTDNTDYTPTQTRLHNGEEVCFSDTTCSHDYSDELKNRISARLAPKYGISPAPVWGERGWDNDPHLGYDWFSTLVWRECERTHIVSKAEMAGYVAPPIERNPLLREY